MANEMEELIGFLSSPSPQVKKVAVDIVRGLTGSEDGLQSLASYSKTVLPSLSRLLGEKKDVSEPATEALVNLSQNSDLAAKMIEMGIIKVTMDILYKQGCDITGLLVMLLVNLTQLDAGVESLLQLEDDKVQGLYVMKLVRSFCTSSNEKKDDPFGHVGSILVNVSKNKAGRVLLLDPKRGLLKQIIRQFDSTSLLRKKGVSGTIRNCCFEADNQLQNLLLISEFLWPALLLPVAGNKVYNEQDTSKMPLELGSALSIERESVVDPEIRIQALEAIYLIVLQGAGRRAFWSVNGPRILQIGYEEEEDPKVMGAYEQIGSLFLVI
ncbi:Armadillo-like helical [Cynara cardunculus var. scolymus]|uniref:Protein HGH1 homolog n=1 Tax=Cynara cardunculus var. scolymus TaxID=59895 RepID=A0A103YAJ0_CYNCS|nr:Armadillo-like helical [Cynara cardunculus var. scolymus]